MGRTGSIGSRIPLHLPTLSQTISMDDQLDNLIAGSILAVLIAGLAYAGFVAQQIIWPAPTLVAQSSKPEARDCDTLLDGLLGVKAVKFNRNELRTCLDRATKQLRTANLD